MSVVCLETRVCKEKMELLLVDVAATEAGYFGVAKTVKIHSLIYGRAE